MKLPSLFLLFLSIIQTTPLAECFHLADPSLLLRRNRYDASRVKLFATPRITNNHFSLLRGKQSSTSLVEQFIEAWNANRISDAMEFVDDNIEFDDTTFPGPFRGKEELERILFFMAEIPDRDTIVVDEVAREPHKVGLRFHTQTGGSIGKKGAAYFRLDPDSGLIRNVFMVQESIKSGEANLKVLRWATTFFGTKSESQPVVASNSQVGTTAADANLSPTTTSTNPFDWFLANRTSSESSSSMTLPEQYFAAWNKRDMVKAASIFSDDIEYDDAAFPAPFQGKEALQEHLKLCAECFPSTFQFCTDDVIEHDDERMIFVRWHVENEGKGLPFTRGCSFYNIQKDKIVRGIDLVEPPVFKLGGLSLATKSVWAKLKAEPIRWVPLTTWFLYMYVVFFSDWFYGLPATALEQRTWEEVRDLSLNFFLVSPILHLPFAPVVHPLLEGVFNLLLSWAAMFACFLSDDRLKKPNLLPMLPMVAGMQFLTSAFLLPYLVTRSVESEDTSPVFQEELTPVARVTERPLLAPVLTVVGTGSILWGILARADLFGGWDERWPSFLDLLSIDRVGSSFLVDLAVFAAFQGWLVNDDVQRRGMDTRSPLVKAARYVPFFGLATYLTFRDPLPSKVDEATDKN